MPKTTYRDTFINSLETEIDNARSMCQFLCLADSMVEKTEKETHTRLTKSSPKWFYNKLASAIGSTATNQSKMPHNARHDIAKNIVEQAQVTAKGQRDEAVSRAVLLGADFNRLMDCVKSVRPMTQSIDSIRNYIELTVDKDAFGNGRMMAIVTDGYRIIRHECPCRVQGNGFTVFLKVPKVKPGKFDMVSIVPDTEGVVVSFDNISLRYEAPPHDGKIKPISSLYNDIQSQRETILTMDVDANYLKELLSGLLAGKGNTSKKRVSLIVGKSQGISENHPYLSLKMDNSEAMLLPLRSASKT